ncbi:MAG: hypothetical protein ACTHLE_07140 [Agriterribacter sp.]
MTKREIAEAIEQLKRELLLFEKMAATLNIDQKDREKQINHYLDTLNKLKRLHNKASD